MSENENVGAQQIVRTIGIFVHATARARGANLAAARRALREKLHSVYIGDSGQRVTDSIDLTSLAFCGGFAAFGADGSANDDAEPAAHYRGSGLATLEQWTSLGHMIPLMFRPVQISPSGEDMRQMTPDTLHEVMDLDQVIRVGLAGHICVESEVYAPEVFVDPEGVVHVEPNAAGEWKPVTGCRWVEGHAAPMLLEAAGSVGRGLAEIILGRPGLYALVWSGREDRSEIVMHCHDSEQIWENRG
ncbi:MULTISPECIES: hypothetical protein [Nocardia]|uniref:hypothetical protein n=1 Tax=Nocardia TaxID=1817 RepID=UPI0013005B83|nr:MULTISPECIES: hypothetical protein [Nocardia]